jgi:hypothetical protein
LIKPEVTKKLNNKLMSDSREVIWKTWLKEDQNTRHLITLTNGQGTSISVHDKEIDKLYHFLADVMSKKN